MSRNDRDPDQTVCDTNVNSLVLMTASSSESHNILLCVENSKCQGQQTWKCTLPTGIRILKPKVHLLTTRLNRIIHCQPKPGSIHQNNWYSWITMFPLTRSTEQLSIFYASIPEYHKRECQKNTKTKLNGTQTTNYASTYEMDTNHQSESALHFLYLVNMSATFELKARLQSHRNEIYMLSLMRGESMLMQFRRNSAKFSPFIAGE